MAGTGPAPKPKHQRRNRVPLKRGDWVELRATTRKVPDLPSLEGEYEWSERTQRAWSSWWKDPASQMWSGADIDLVEHLASVHEIWITRSTVQVLAEIRQLRDALGLTPKGKQDRRWFVAPPADVHDLDDRRKVAASREELERRVASSGKS